MRFVYTHRTSPIIESGQLRGFLCAIPLHQAGQPVGTRSTENTRPGHAVCYTL